MRYHFRVSPPEQRVKLRILATDGGGPLLAATFNGHRRALDTRPLLCAFFAFPMVTFKIMAAIHWEALRLWLKGALLVPRHNAVFDAGLATGKGNGYNSGALAARAKQ